MRVSRIEIRFDSTAPKKIRILTGSNLTARGLFFDGSWFVETTSRLYGREDLDPKDYEKFDLWVADARRLLTMI